VNRYAAALSRHPLPAHAVGETAGEVLEALGGADPDLLWCFATPHFADGLDDVVEVLSSLLDPRVVVAATASGVVGGDQEVEAGPALSVFAACLPDAEIHPVHLRAVHGPEGAEAVGWPDATHGADLLLGVADPFTFPTDAVLARLAVDRPGLRVLGGLASGAAAPGRTRLWVDGRVVTDGLVGVACEGVPVHTVVAQGARPVGDPWVVTAGGPGRIDALGGRPVLERLRDLVEAAPPEERALLQGLQIGFVVDEHRAEFGRGDFLVRSVLGVDRRSGSVTTAEAETVGRTVQFQVRDAATADEDLRLALADPDLSAAAVLCFTCVGRGRDLFGVPGHDAGAIADRFGTVPVSGMFCSGEIGPVGTTSFVHGHTASLACFGR